MDAPPPTPEPMGPATGRSRSFLPLVGLGLLTSAAALFGVWAIGQATEDFNLMGLYHFWVFPTGALIVGIAAGSGYGIGSWWTGVRISRSLLWLVVALQIAVYFAAQYIEFRHLLAAYGGGEQMGFFDFFDESTRAISFREEGKSDYGDPLGGWGYAFRLLELAGFVLGGLVVPLALKAKAYCESCQVYMRTRHLVTIPASVPAEKIKKKDLEAQTSHQQVQDEAWQAGHQALEALRQSAEAGRASELQRIVDEHAAHAKEVAKLPIRLTVDLSVCPSCGSGILRAASLTGHGDQIRREDLGTWPVSAGLTGSLTI
ncbi:MAG: hypothetical protein JXR96_13770 [Deltaproteobacteria bacterium]|nr:hypothetical protein [Deltaproteobacteria bacterium]